MQEKGSDEQRCSNSAAGHEREIEQSQNFEPDITGLLCHMYIHNAYMCMNLLCNVVCKNNLI